MNASANSVQAGVAYRLEAALLSGRDPSLAMPEIVDICDSDADAPWEVLALVDQYYRRGRISDATFRLVNSQIQRFAVGGPAARAATRASLRSVTPAAESHREPPAEPAQAAEPLRPAEPLQPAVDARTTRPFAAIAAQMFPDAGAHAADAAPLPERVVALHRVMPAGTVLSDRYVLEGVIDHGTVDTVYRAVDRYRAELPHEEQRVAVKFPAAGVDAHRPFFRAQGLTHPHITRVLECGRSGELDFHTLEYQRGKLLRDVLREMPEPMPRAYALAILRDVGAAIVYAHEHGVVHGSLDPKTVMITVDGGVSVLNFDALPAHLDPSHDLHALACIACELLSGARPFPGHDAISARQTGARARRPRGLGWRQWRALKQGLNWPALANKPVAVKDWLAHFDLNRAARRLPILAKVLVSKSPRRWTPVLTLAAVAVVAVAGALTVFEWPGLAAFTRRNPRQPAPALMPAAAAATVPGGSVSEGPPPAPVENAAGGDIAPATGPAAAEARAPVDDRPGRIGFAADSISVPADAPAARVVVHRTSGSHGDVGFTWWTEDGSARAGEDYIPLGTRHLVIPDGTDSVTLFVPLVAPGAATGESHFFIALGHPTGGATVGAIPRLTVNLAPR